MVLDCLGLAASGSCCETFPYFSCHHFGGFTPKIKKLRVSFVSRGIGRITTCSLFSKSHLSFARLTRFPYSSIFPSATGVGRFARLSGRWAVALASNPTGVAFLFLKHFRALVSPLLPFSPDCRADMEIAPSKAFQQSNTVNKLRRRDVCSGRPLEARRCYCP